MSQSVHHKKRKKRKKRRKNSKRPVVIVIMLLLLLLFAFLFLIKLISNISSDTELPVPSEEIVNEPQPSMPPSELDPMLFGNENGYKTYASPQTEAFLGLDVSSHQGWIDWYAVSESPVDYVILRAGYRGYKTGEIQQDEYLEYNLATASEAGLDIGIYFFSQAITPEEAIAEAHTVLKLIEGYRINYPVYFDWEPVEDPTARTATISTSELTACAIAFCETVREAGYTPGIYFNFSLAMDYYNLYELKDYEFWLAEYSDIPSFPWNFQMWQYTSSGTVQGIETKVDLNLSFKPYGS